ncbi:PadR family transcriptional regulator [Metallosphaera tengchongensis]|uniref:PadR family transcriptional regulator n=1 Tax=Metallosphaera tengchongensis TaxID=1532350 RepID=A0A6N0NVV8_9CREN|nr:PadR family transcriptional regulator [Metallosphaera tengchongensis]QKR00355.1 PadR family transcriptional regulator [Metallosphaera tengchongensis]
MKMNIERLRRGALKMLILDALVGKPMHVYEIMKSIEKKFNGVYKPSPGSIYPVLKTLIGEGLVEVKEVNGRKVYEITQLGREKWEKGKSEIKSVFSSNSGYRRVISSLFDMSLVIYNYKDKLADQEVYDKINAILMECRTKLEETLEARSSSSPH